MASTSRADFVKESIQEVLQRVEEGEAGSKSGVPAICVEQLGCGLRRTDRSVFQLQARCVVVVQQESLLQVGAGGASGSL